MTKTTPAVQPVVRTSAGLRDAIFDEIDFIRNGESNPTRANALSKLAGGIVDTVRMEIEVQKMSLTASKPGAPINQTTLGEPLMLGHE